MWQWSSDRKGTAKRRLRGVDNILRRKPNAKLTVIAWDREGAAMHSSVLAAARVEVANSRGTFLWRWVSQIKMISPRKLWQWWRLWHQ